MKLENKTLQEEYNDFKARAEELLKQKIEEACLARLEKADEDESDEIDQ